ncbi:antitoxin [Fournierella sp.]|uniref:antitoxin n=1 Tax=Allofournierella sp. TaxID=1940256 RepID=UPI0025C0B3D9|nr:antitoxin [Fournierella sp.]
MSGKTSSAAKNRYNAKAYDQIPLRVKKGQKEIIQKRAEQLNKSVNGYITDLIEEDLAGSNLLEE